MIAYYNFCKRLRQKYGGAINTRPLIPIHSFRYEAATMLHIHDAEMNRFINELEMFGLARRRREYVELAPSLLD